ncbi:MAG: glycosyltransferase family 87 protein [Vulcanimicrobiaceae bacterium]
MGESGVPLRLSRDRIWLYGIGCAIIVSLPFILLRQWFQDVSSRADFANYWSAGATVGSSALTDVRQHTFWQLAHHLNNPEPFVYPPGFAWAYAPLAHLPPMTAMIAEELGMAALFVLAAVLAGRVYGFKPWFALIAVFAWGPAINSIEVGQNTGLALVLALSATLALVKRHELFAGLAIGLLLYKPTDALPLILLLAVRREWRGLGVVAVCGIGWYLISVPAAHGDWLWPIQYAHTIQAWYAGDLPGNAYRAFTIPTALLAFGASPIVAFGIAAAILLLALPVLARVSTLEAASMAMLIGLATNPHALPYEAALLLPGVCYAMTHLHEPWRTRIVATVYVIASLSLVTPHGAHSLALICIGGAGWWLLASLKRLPLFVAGASTADGNIWREEFDYNLPGA